MARTGFDCKSERPQREVGLLQHIILAFYLIFLILLIFFLNLGGGGGLLIKKNSATRGLIVTYNLNFMKTEKLH